MKKLIYFIFALSLFSTQSLFAQDHQQNHRRYWYYRTRLINDFTKLGTTQGHSLMIAERNRGKKDINQQYKLAQYGADQIDLMNMYLIVLALEYKLLSRAQQDVSETLYEIYCILYSINRLDLEAEAVWNNPPSNIITGSPQSLNGFMLRDDVPTDFLQSQENLEHFNYGIKFNQQNYLPDAGFVALNPTDVRNSIKGYCGSDYIDEVYDTKFSNYIRGKQTNTNDLSLPHDKYHSMLVGLMFINKYLPMNVTYNNQVFQDSTSSIKQEARNIANRCYNYIKGPNFSWHLKEPNGNDIDVGPIAIQYSFPLSKMACNVNQDFPWNSQPCANYTDPNSSSFGTPVYDIAGNSWQPTLDAAVFMAWDQAGSNYPASNIPAFIGMQTNTMTYGIEWAELLRKVLHQDGALLKPSSIYLDPLGLAPCNGPYNYGEGNHGGFEWSSPDRTEHPERRGDGDNNSRFVFRGDYPGIDYMLLHNLFYEYQNQLMDKGSSGLVSQYLGGLIVWVYNALSTNVGPVSSSVCNVVHSFLNNLNINVNVGCPPVNTQGSGGSGNSGPVSPYFAYNYMDNFDQTVWPRKLSFANGNQSLTIGTTNLPAKVAVFQDLKSYAHIYASSSPSAQTNLIPSQIEYRAGKTITLLPGFTVDAGSTFHAHIQQYLCNGNSDPMNLRTSQDSLNNDSINIYENDYLNDAMNSIPIHAFPEETINNNNRENQNSNEIKSDDQDEQFFQKALGEFRTCKVYPNPNDGTFFVEYPLLKDETASITIIDIMGNKVFASGVLDELSKYKVVSEELKPGIYFMLININNEKQYKVKVIVE